MDLLELQAALEASWDAETAQLPDPLHPWDPANPARGQCCVSTMIVQKHFGGQILRATSNFGTVHYWNQLPTGVWYDSTRMQFGPDENFTSWAPADEDVYRFADTVKKGNLLHERIRKLGVL